MTTIRKATINEINELLAIEECCFKKNDRFNRKQFKYAIQRTKGAIYVYTCGEIILGYLYYLLVHNNIRLYSLAIMPSYQRKGIGKALLDFFHGIVDLNVLLEVRKDNQKAIEFYLKHGYNIYGIRDYYYEDGTDAILMKRTYDAQG